MKDNSKKPLNKEGIRYLLILVVNTLIFFAVYRVALYYAAMTDKTFGSFVVMICYGTVMVGFVLGYLIYNRFLYRNGVSPEQLPKDWSEEQKQQFFEDRDLRLKKSKWMMLIIFPLIFTFLIEAIDLFIIDEYIRK